MKALAYASLIALIFFIFAKGLYFSPLCEINPEEDLEFQAEYLTGILTASGIIFGLWVVVFEPEPKEDKEWALKNITKEPFFLSLLFLIIFVFLIALTAVEVFSPSLALLWGVIGFIVNATFFTVNVYHFKFRKSTFKEPE